MEQMLCIVKGCVFYGKFIHDNAQHLLHALKEIYTISEYWEAKLYIGIRLNWDYSKQTVDLSMPGYVTAAL